MRVIGLSGRKQQGKSTIAKYLVEHYLDVYTYSFATPLKQACHILFGGKQEHWFGSWKEELLPAWGMSPRQILQEVGTELFRNNFDEQFWIQVARNKLNEMRGSTYHDITVIIDDIRFDNEARLVITDFDGCVYEVMKLPFSKENPDAHASEQGINSDLIAAQLIADNGDIETLRRNADWIADQNGLRRIGLV